VAQHTHLGADDMVISATSALNETVGRGYIKKSFSITQQLAIIDFYYATIFGGRLNGEDGVWLEEGLISLK
jgi:hypothetical protein